MIGERIHNYEVNAHLGQGGMGNVYRATDSMLGREVALKMLHPQLTIEPQFLERFKKEARILAQLLHPNIAVIYNFIEQGGNHFMVMEYVEGASLDELLKKYSVLPAEFVVPVFIQALEGLKHAHRKNIFHRDIKPANLMITEDGILKLMDFGIAKIAGEQKMTQVNKIVGTLEFMAPELIEGKDASSASDIYSMGATLYELISGKIPFEADTDFNMMQSILKSKPKPPEKLNPSIPKALSDIVLKAMDKNPEHRYPNAGAFQQALITAFPNFREIDMNVLKIVQQSVNASKNTKEVTQHPRTSMDSASFETRVEMSDSPSAFQLFKQKILTYKKLSLAILGMLFLALSIFTLTAIRGNKSGKAAIAKSDSSRQEVLHSNTSGNTNGSNFSSKVNIELPLPDNRIPVMNDEPVIEQKEIPAKKEKPKKIIKNEIKNPVQKPLQENEKEKPSEIKAPENKEILINSEVMVNLSLIGTPDMNQKKKSEQRVKFSVTHPVYYNGATIIKQGAIASGSLTIGSRRTDIKIDYVEGVNGKPISLRAERAHGKRADIESNKTYNAIVQPGTRLSL